MAIMTESQLREYLKKNKNAKFSEVGADTSVAPIGSGNMLTNILGRVIADPFARLGEGVGSLTNKALNFITGSNVGYDRIYEPVLGTKLSQAAANKPLTEGVLKGTAGIASLGVPAGRGVTGLAKSGAIAGGLGGYGAAEEGQGLGGALKGAALGGAIGAAAGGLEKLLNIKVKPKSYKGEKYLLEHITPDSYKKATGYTITPKELDRVKNAYLQRATDASGGRIATTLDDLMNDAPMIKGSIRAELEPLLDTSVPNFKTNVMNKLGGKTKQLNIIAQKAAEKGDTRLLEAIQKANFMDNATIGDVKNLVDSLDDIVKRGSKGIVVQEGIANENAVVDAFRKAVRSEIKGPADKLVTELSRTINIADEITRVGSRNPTLGVGGLRVNVPKKVQRGFEKAVTGGSNIQQGVQGGISGMGLGQAASQLAPLSRFLGLGAGVGMAQDGEQAMPIDETQTQPMDGVQPEVNPLQFLLMAQQMAPNASITQQMDLAKFLMPTGGASVKKTDVQKKAGTALNSVNKLEQILASDPSVIWKQYLPFQLGDPEGQMFKAVANDITDALARMRTGAVINNEEFKLYSKYVPKITDTPQAVQFKIQQLRDIFGTIYEGETTMDSGALQQLLGQ